MSTNPDPTHTSAAHPTPRPASHTPTHPAPPRKDSEVALSVSTAPAQAPPPPPPLTSAGRYAFKQLIGSGSTGHVFIARVTKPVEYLSPQWTAKSEEAPPGKTPQACERDSDGETGGHDDAQALVAVKVVRLSFLRSASSRKAEDLRREVDVLRRAKHAGIVHLHQVVQVEEDDAYCIVMDYAAGGDLHQHVERRGALPEVEAARLFIQLIEALEYCHSVLRVSHSDLKLENIMFDNLRARNVKLVDFGLSHELGTVAERRRAFDRRGTPAYAAPELIDMPVDGYLPDVADIWSAGVVLFALVSGYLPFQDTSFMRLAEHICSGEYELPEGVSPDLRDLIARLLQPNPAARATIPEIKQHPWYLAHCEHARVVSHTAPLHSSPSIHACWYSKGRSPVAPSHDTSPQMDPLPGKLDLDDAPLDPAYQPRIPRVYEPVHRQDAPSLRNSRLPEPVRASASERPTVHSVPPRIAMEVPRDAEVRDAGHSGSWLASPTSADPAQAARAAAAAARLYDLDEEPVEEGGEEDAYGWYGGYG